MSTLINPFLLYGLLTLGALGVCLALPRKAVGPQVLGALVAALAGGLLVLFLSLKAGIGGIPNLYFYIFSAVGLGAALRVITHPKPVYAALYFILTVIASAGLFLILSAEFMAFAIIIVYAGAILITYLFVIMLATQSPEEQDVEVLAPYDVQAREPIAATVVGFLLLAVLTTMFFRGLPEGAPNVQDRSCALLAEMPRKVERVLRNSKLLSKDQSFEVALNDEGKVASIIVKNSDGSSAPLDPEKWPSDLKTQNIESLGFNLLREHQGAIEIAGVILLMAMLGAVVLSRKQVQIDEEAKMRQSRLLSSADTARSEPLGGAR